MIQGSCPSCGGEVKFVSKASLTAVCPFCASLLMRKDLDLELIGKVAQLQEDGTPFQLGTRGTYKGKPFAVIGRIQFDHGSGYWNEWYLNVDAWIGEAQGLYVFTKQTPSLGSLPAWDGLEAGASVTVNNENFQVKELQEVRCVGGEGELPFPFESGSESTIADLATSGTRFATIDYSETPPLLFMGAYAGFDELQLTNLRRVDGW